MKTLKLGDRGKEVLDIQARLRSIGYDVGTDGVDGLFGPETHAAILHFQQARGLLADGVVAENTWCELVETGYKPGERLLYLRVSPFRGDDVLDLQRSMNRLGFNAGPEDGIFGRQTERAVIDFQKNAGLVVDGMVDDSVLKAMSKVTKDGEPHSLEAKIPDRNGGYAAGRRISQLTIVIDPGHGGADAGAVSVTGMREKDLSLAVALGLAELLESDGATTVLTRRGDEDVPLYRRPEIANYANADLCVSIHLNNSSNDDARGAAAYYFCRQGYFSEPGMMLAQHVVERVAKELDIPAIQVLGRNFAILRETGMTAIMVEPVFITDRMLNGLLSDQRFISRISMAVYGGLSEYFSK